MDFQISKDIPAPAKRLSGILQVIRTMEVGDSFFAPKAKTTSWRQNVMRDIEDKIFVSRTLVENGVKGVRIWRVS